jgi:hypothetical protein
LIALVLLVLGAADDDDNGLDHCPLGACTVVPIAGNTLLTVAGAAVAGVNDDCCDGFATGTAAATTSLAIALLDDTLCGDELLSLVAVVLCCSGTTGTAAIAPNVPSGGCCGDAKGFEVIGLGCTLVAVVVAAVVGPDCSGTGSIDIGIGDLSCCCCDDSSHSHVVARATEVVQADTMQSKANNIRLISDGSHILHCAKSNTWRSQHNAKVMSVTIPYH